MSEDRFFQQVNAAMSDYSPEVPASVYAGMRKKLWWSNFTRLSATRFNVWYAALILTGGLVWFTIGTANTGSTSTEAVNVSDVAIVESPAVEPAEDGQNQLPASPTTLDNSTQTASAAHPKSAASKEAVVSTDVAAEQSNQPDLVGEATTSEGQLVNETIANQTQSVPGKQGSKRGLKVTTPINSADKK